MTEQLLQFPLSKENYNTSNQLNNVPPGEPTPTTPKTLADIPQSLKMVIPDSSENPVGDESSDFEDVQAE